MLQSKDAVVGILSGFMAGLLVTAIGSRIMMRVIALVDPFTHPKFTVDGTLFLVVTGIVFGAALGAPWGLLFMAVRGLLPGPAYWKGVLFGLLLLLISGGIFFSIDPSEEFSNFEPAWLGVSLFSVLFPVYGLLVGVFASRFDRWLSTTSERRLKSMGFVVLANVCLLGLLLNIAVISERL